MSSRYLSVFGAAALSLVVAACSGGEHGDMGGMEGMDMGGHGGEEITFGEAGMASMASRTITVTIEDSAYDLKDLKVKNGEVIRFIIVNKDETEHEFTLGTAEMQAADRKMMAMQADHGDSMEMAVPNSVSVGELETKELTWKFAGSGMIEFACNVPGHYEGGMKGDIMIMN
ncbi:MAG: cupredoxin domain-containing protein [Rhodospirillaceae bacterium]|nr:cupredoxin domain-containing protein [Rhodospirillaceae bacterium]